MTIIIVFLIGCAHPVKRVIIPEGANTEDEIASQNTQFVEARATQVDVLARANFIVAANFLKQAKEENMQGKSSDEVLKTIGYSRAYLQLAIQEAISTNARVKEITKARGQALLAGARDLPYQLNELDQDFMDLASRSEKVSAVKKASLQSNYLALEHEAIKYNNLQKAKEILATSKIPLRE